MKLSLPQSVSKRTANMSMQMANRQVKIWGLLVSRPGERDMYSRGTKVMRHAVCDATRNERSSATQWDCLIKLKFFFRPPHLYFIAPVVVSIRLKPHRMTFWRVILMHLTKYTKPTASPLAIHLVSRRVLWTHHQWDKVRKDAVM
jgi:hypothetical protein